MVALAAALTLLATAPAMAQEAEEELIPPDNSAVNQYTEAYPTADGEKDLQHGSARTSPQKALGAKNARRLERQGPAGRAAAEAAAATAPVEEETRTAGSGGGESIAPAGAGGSRGSSQPPRGSATPEPSGRQTTDVANANVGGRSGFGAILAQATGSGSSGHLGLGLPLLILATLLWAVATGLRRTRGATP